MASNFAVEAVFRAVDRMTAPVNRMQNRVGQFTRALDSGLDNVNNRVNGMLGTLGKGAAGIAALGAAGIGLGVIANELTQADVMAQKLARSVGISIDTVDALTAAIAPAGFEFESVIDLMEELNNKMGESAGIEEIGGVTDALQILKLSYADIAKLSPEDQFKAVADAALKMKDAQAAASAVDILMGGDANKIIGLLREKGLSIDEITGKYEKMNFRTAESRAGAEKLQASFALVKGVIGNVASEVAGLAGNALGPVTDQMQLWVSANHDLIATNILSTFDSMVDSVTWLVENFESIVTWTKRIAIGLGVFLTFVFILKTFILVMTAVNIVMAANPITLMILGIIALIAVVALMIVYWDDVTRVFRDAGAWIDYVIAAIALMTGPIGWLIAAALFIYRHWEVLGPLFTALWASVVAIFSGAVAAVSGFFSRMSAGLSRDWAMIKAFFASGVAFVVSMANSLINGWNAVGGFFSRLWAGIKSAFASAVDFISNKITWITNKAQALMNLGGRVTKFFGGGGGGSVNVVTPQARNASANLNASNSTVTINDRTNRAEVSKGRLAPGVTLRRTGGMDA